jgi:hypothetical protein
VLDVVYCHEYGNAVVKVAQHGQFRIYVYVEIGAPHHEAHCHVLWPDGQASVSIETWEVIRGDTLPAGARKLVLQHRADSERVWQQLNER